MSSVPPGTVGRPIPEGRGRWRLTAHSRQFSDLGFASTQVAELHSARSRQLVQAWNTPGQLQFSMDGHSPEAALITELQTDIVAWRWDDQPGALWSTARGCDVPVFRGIVSQSEDEVSEQTHTVTFTCHDYLAMLARRFFTTSPTWTQVDQDTLAGYILGAALAPASASGQTFQPGAYLPLVILLCNPDGSTRSLSGTLRDRSYTSGAPLDQVFDDLAKVDGGFDYDLMTSQRAADLGIQTMSKDAVRIFFPYQGVQRFDVPLVYGSTVASFTRSLSSTDYTNYWRVIGEAPPDSPDGTPPMFSEVWNADSNNVTVLPIGLWMGTDNAADVTIQSTLDQKAAGDLKLAGNLHASWTMTLRPGAYRWGAPNMGDICPVYIQSGRLNIQDNIRVLGITYNIGDDGQEDVDLTIARPSRDLTQLYTQADRDADALTRR